MKISVNVDCTPEEARRFFGLPDVTSVNDMIVGAMAEKAKENLDSLSDPKTFWEQAMATGESGMSLMSQMMASAMGETAPPKKGK
ncbi:MAG: DUF6489 family protein [Parvularcula sp.]